MKKNSGRGSFEGATPSEFNSGYDFGGQWSPSELELARRQARKKKNQRSALIAALSSFLVLGTLVIVIVTSPGWETLRNTFFKWAYGVEVLPKIILGFGTNAMLTVIAGTSVALLVIITYSAYVAEVIRSGILTVHPSQRAAARSLGLSHFQTLRHVVLPQALKRVTPPLLNDLVALIKDTGLVSILGVTDAVRAAQIQTAKTFNYTPYVMAAIVFLLVTIPLTRWTDRMLRNSLEKQNAQGQA